MVWMFCILPMHTEVVMCGVGEKPVAHLMKFHLLQWELAKGNS